MNLSISRRIEYIDEVANLHRIGRHSRQIIQDILSSGISREVKECKASEWFQCMEVRGLDWVTVLYMKWGRGPNVGAVVEAFLCSEKRNR